MRSEGETPEIGVRSWPAPPTHGTDQTQAFLTVSTLGGGPVRGAAPLIASISLMVLMCAAEDTMYWFQSRRNRTAVGV